MEVLTNSKRQLFRACRRAFYYRYEMRLEPRIEKETRRRGTAFGLALHAVADGESAIETLIDYYDRQDPDSQAEADALAVEEGITRALVSGYTDRYGLEGRREVEFERPLVNPDTGRQSRSFLLGGKIDGMTVVGKNHAVLIEDKLTQQIQQNRIESLPLDEQTTEYLDALLWRGWTGEVEYRYTRWPSIKQRKDEGPLDFLGRFVGDVDTRPEFYFINQRLRFPTEHLEEHRRERWQIAKDILDCRRTERWYRSPATCDMFGGGCRYFPLCAHRPDAGDQYKIADENPELEAYHGATA